MYFFKTGNYVRYDRGADRVDDGYPLGVGPNWPGLAAAGFNSGVDTALNLGAGFAYFFKGSKYVRYRLDSPEGVEFGPAPIADHWPGLEARGFASNLDAAVNFGNGFVYFFKGSHYVRYKVSSPEGADSGPTPIAAEWPGMAVAGFGSDLDSAITWGDGSTYFFKDDQYVRFDHADNKVPGGYPLAIADRWPGMASAGFDDGLELAVDVIDLRKPLLDASTQQRPASVNGPVFIDRPWRGVLHTTEGSTLAGALSTLDSKKVWPHLTIEPNTFKSVQHYPLSQGARALTDQLTPQNAARCIQIEIVGFAAQTQDWAPEQLEFIKDVMRQIEDLVPIPRTADVIFLSGGDHPANRMSVNQWNRFSGWCGHQHVPGNSHWDPGAIDIAALLS
ncbi:hemopexin repeat-containing protein [Rhodococcus kronopolitis]|uniref:Hemopexin repeat-containing protein n=1 Tax=Rhodococcus kronopolitis TaxID=1460226 RepID=A0ABV9FS17_9NOCA